MKPDPMTSGHAATAWPRRTFLRSAAAACALGGASRSQGAAATRSADPCRLVFDLDPDPKNQAVLDWLRQGGYCWGIEAPWQTPVDRIRWLREQGWNVILGFYAHPETRARHHRYKKWPMPEIGRAHV